MTHIWCKVRSAEWDLDTHVVFGQELDLVNCDYEDNSHCVSEILANKYLKELFILFSFAEGKDCACVGPCCEDGSCCAADGCNCPSPKECGSKSFVLSII